MPKPSVPAIAAAIAFADLKAGDCGYRDPADLWAEMSDHMRVDYRRMARAAINAMPSDQKPESPATHARR